MSRCLPSPLLALAAVVLAASPDVSSAQPHAAAPEPIARRALVASGYVHGTVTDQLGRTVDGVSILAMGATLAAAESDLRGRFALQLPPGEYILRAAREGYLSTFREPVRVEGDALVERNIRLVSTAREQPDEAMGALPPVDPDDHAHSETAWRLRHLPRTILRDSSGLVGQTSDAGGDWERTLPGQPLAGAVEGSMRAAASLFARTDFDGELNFLTTGSLAASGMRPGGRWPQGIAYVSLGAPVGSAGDWSVSASMASGGLPAWTLIGKFEADAGQRHAYGFGMSHSAQKLLDTHAAPGLVPDHRAVTSLYLFDRWQLRPEVEVNYGLRFEHYSYLLDPGMLSPRAGVRLEAAPRVFVTASASQRVTAPGADQFLPATSVSGPWLPPQRTFSPLMAGGELRPERVRHYDVALEYELGFARETTMRVSRFSQATINQLATLFGLDETSEVGHYYIGMPGNVLVEGWAIGVDGRILEHVRGSINYTWATGTWSATRGRPLRGILPSAARRGTEGAHDLTGTLQLSVPDTSTVVDVTYRVSDGFSSTSRTSARPVGDARFSLELRQQLPYRPFRGSTFNLLFAIRTLLHDAGVDGSFYDELLTVAPPTRLTGGLQLWF